ncbi:MAG: hypothetical protein RLY43_213 [Bacteroidota bacterium]
MNEDLENETVLLDLIRKYLNIAEDDNTNDDLLLVALNSVLLESQILLGYKLEFGETIKEYEGNGRDKLHLLGVNLAITKVEYKEYYTGTLTEIPNTDYIFYNNNLRLINGLIYHPSYYYKITYNEGYTDIPLNLMMIIVKGAASEFLQSNQGNNRLNKTSGSIGDSKETYIEYDLAKYLKPYELW